MIKRILVFLGFAVLFTLSISANDLSAEEFYYNQQKLSGAEELSEHLPNETKEFLEQNGIDLKMQDWTKSVEPKNVFSHIWYFLKSGAKTPISAGAVILCLTLISAALGGMDIKSASSISSGYAVALSAVAAISAPIFSCQIRHC